MKKRTFKLLSATVILIVAGVLYYFINKFFGLSIPCPIRFITGLYCPGCGVTGMCISLLELDFVGAFFYNPAIMTALPIFIYFIVTFIYRYIKTGNLKPKKIENIILYVLIIYLLIFGVIRNIPLPVFEFMRPY